MRPGCSKIMGNKTIGLSDEDKSIKSPAMRPAGSSLSEIKLYIGLHCKKRLAVFPSPAGMSLTKLSLAGNNLIIPGQGEFGK
jgi:hypothetical protein